MPENSAYLIGTLFPIVALVGAVGWNITCRINDRRLAAQVAYAFATPSGPLATEPVAGVEQWQLTSAA
jgi:hypothetical protein